MHKILRCFSSRSSLSAVVPLRSRTRHPFAVSDQRVVLNRRLSLCSLPVSKQFDGGLGSLRSVAQSATDETWQAAR
jgi:hypothetical protein